MHSQYLVYWPRHNDDDNFPLGAWGGVAYNILAVMVAECSGEQQAWQSMKNDQSFEDLSTLSYFNGWIGNISAGRLYHVWLLQATQVVHLKKLAECASY